MIERDRINESHGNAEDKAVLEALALSFLPRFGPKRFLKMFGSLGSIHCFFTEPPSKLNQLLPAGPRVDWAFLRSKAHLAEAEKELKKAQARGIRVLPLTSPLYPEPLLTITDPPMVCYLRGAWPVAPIFLSIVGSRRATAYGQRTARRLSRELSQAGAVIVSGLAEGVDREAHEGALEGGSPTIAVLGGGIERIYPAAHRSLAKRIERCGALLSEYPTECPPKPQHFPIRNRIISALSRAVIVVEAANKSGALITADQALEQGREVLAVPGCADSALSSGTHWLIRQGAGLVTSAADVFEWLGVRIDPGLASFVADNPKMNAMVMTLSPGQQFLRDRVPAGDSISVDVLVSLARRPISEVLADLSFLEIKGIMKQLPGGRWSRKD